MQRLARIDQQNDDAVALAAATADNDALQCVAAALAEVREAREHVEAN